MKLHKFIPAFMVLFLYSHFCLGNAVGTDAQNFNPLTSGLDFVTVHSSETLDTGVLNLGLFFNYAVNTLPYFEPNQVSRTKYNDSLTGMDLNFGLGLMKNWDIGFSFPHILDQSIDDSLDLGYFANRGNTEIRFNTKYRWFGNDEGGFATVLSMNVDRIENNPYTGLDAGPTINLEVVYDRLLNQLTAFGVNLGYRFRNSGTPVPGIPIEPFEDQFIGSVAISHLLGNVRLIGEVFGSFPAKQSDESTDRTQSSLEFLAGMKYNINHNLAWHAGLGTELSHGTSTPDWRVYTGLNYSIGPLWGKDEPIIYAKNKPEVAKSLQEKPESEEVFVVEGINFEFNSFELTTISKQVLKQLAEYLKKPPALSKLIIEGHTDSIGPEEYNQHLSEKRAASVMNFLIEQGLPKDKLSSIGYGELRPIADNGNYQGRKKNRRVEFQINRNN